MARRSSTNAEIRDSRREEILRAALRVFAERGLKSATVSDIAREAGISHGLLYHYFASKHALIDALFDQKIDRLRAISAEAVATDGSVATRLERALELMIVEAESDPDLALFVTQAMTSRSLQESTRERLVEHARSALSQLAKLIAAGQQTGEIADDASPEELATAVAALVRGLSLFYELQLAHERPGPPADVIRRLLRPQLTAPQKRPASPKRRTRKESQ